MSAVTTKQIADHLGLSQPTVSRILSGDTKYRVAAETRRRVLETARDLGYRPNSVALSLRRRRTDILGFYTGYGFLDARNDFLAEIVGSLQMACDAQGLDLLLHGVHRGSATTDEVFRRLIDRRIDGLFLHTRPDDPLAARLADCSLPVVALADPLPGIPSVCGDDAAGMRLLVDHLWGRGYRRIAFVGPDVTLTSVERRYRAFVDALGERGVAESGLANVRVFYEDAAGALETLLARPERPDAVCCWNDRTAYNMLKACDARGLRVPDYLAVAGFDGFLDTKAPVQRLVTVAMPWTDVAWTAARTLVALVREEAEPFDRGKKVAFPPPAEQTLPATLVDGDTA